LAAIAGDNSIEEINFPLGPGKRYARVYFSSLQPGNVIRYENRLPLKPRC
jgi:hypothetical protein